MKFIKNLFKPKIWKEVKVEKIRSYQGESPFEESHCNNPHASAIRPIINVYAHHFICLNTGKTKIVERMRRLPRSNSHRRHCSLSP